MERLSVGNLPSTLGSYLKLSVVFFGEQSAAVKFLKDKIAGSPNGEAEEVIVDESQMLYLLASMNKEAKAP